MGAMLNGIIGQSFERAADLCINIASGQNGRPTGQGQMGNAKAGALIEPISLRKQALNHALQSR
jgi:hypothetical protein